MMKYLLYISCISIVLGLGLIINPNSKDNKKEISSIYELSDEQYEEIYLELSNEHFIVSDTMIVNYYNNQY